jgi:c-di-GMP-related signal transduction protein
MGVALAIDDFDIYGSDFRMSEVLAGMYDYIKIEMPINESQRELFNRFSIDFKIGKIILEKVEDIEEVNDLVKPFALQGFFLKS